ncbi:RNA polymerase sigma factor [Jidongwangia harbinensis]|uniref:RNA polymerase sigma factor n=1 Tax=Jidongwangia harbinensis TaxID=2878561 RepID=UPI001CD93C7A|nr:RNA polymerase sigma factor [Jidongwangia harbinensis]MCA2219573.1 RNA polymerase sigma factor [Jidongwangia harbinensis]
MTATAMVASDEELGRRARGGDATAFATLTERHRAALRATAIACLGTVDEADDAVQEAVLLALRRLPQLRDPQAAGAWLKAIVRNVCRMQLRSRRPAPVAEPQLLLPSATEPGPEEAFDRNTARDWVWHGVATLSEPVREVTLLRYFTRFSSYEQIAQVCGIRVDTVGSRLRDGRRALARALRETAGEAHAAADAVAAAQRRTAQQHAATINDGHGARVFDDWFRPDLSLTLMGHLVGDRATLRAMTDMTLSAGVTVRLHDAIGSRDVVVWDMNFVNPSDDPEHCPPATAWLLRLRGGRVARLRVAYGTKPHP